jgi:hypothetical protein
MNTVILFVPQQEAWIVERFGKYQRVLQPVWTTTNQLNASDINFSKELNAGSYESLVWPITMSTVFSMSYFQQVMAYFQEEGKCILYEKVCQWTAAGQWSSSCTPVSSTNKTDSHDIAEI